MVREGGSGSRERGRVGRVKVEQEEEGKER